MKRCPECYSSFPDTNQFCELDGTTLVAEYSDSDLVAVDRIEQERRAVLASESRNPDPHQYWKTLALVAVAAVGVMLFFVYHAITREAENSSNQPLTNMAAQQQIPLPPSRSVPTASASPSTEPSPSPSATPSPAVQAESARLALSSSSQVSTGENEKVKRGQVTIWLTNGTTIEADEAWETGEGIWYRRRGVVTLLLRDQVKVIERAIEKASPQLVSPTVTPTSSPTASP